MDLLREVTDWLAGKTGLTLGQDLHAGNLPPEGQDLCAVVLERGGVPAQPRLTGRIGAYALQVLVRGPSYFQARDLAYQLDAWLSDCAGMDLPANSEWAIHVCQGVAAPQFLGFDGRGRPEFSTNYTLRGYEKAAWAAA